MSTLNERLIQLKNERGLLQKDIARDVGLALRTYQYYETGQRKPDSDTLIALADYFDVSLDYLVGRSDDPARH
ncbi:helix-turn-helix transcriptional regulator [Anaerotruncus sp. 1XD42-93]|uniref:helix-turn-helix domain-containing protein n=1 Tax=Anaerotruncus sp. 1XD42-93 TaxID=2320853 RepID=UPI000EA02340|nr:helix-turn-helix transcriptional regulator [Anaerotruncus sp. 1XD42-93]NBK18451.1 XRE family transcriptional regulator [Anaerotruncus sp. 1XD42-93]NCE74865.1 XRE family transcriptional regulator [Anaerotruncus sp. X29]RKJ86543.1 XRE family transcriptional regulator [Anaerotruncus sp. 1XD22-93]